MSIEKQQKIVEILREKYNPIAILLHGSRAVGKARSHSDWDIIMIIRDQIPRRQYRESIDGEDVEWKAFNIPKENDSIIDIFEVYLQFAKVLW